MRDVVRSYRLYAAWEYDREEQELNEASKKGLQLVKGGCFHSVFRKDNNVRYVYQLDYNTDIEDKLRYKEMFEEQGWEYINSTLNGWHYFRKLYKEGVDENEYKIYTDKESLYEMQNRWFKLAIVLVGLFELTSIFNIIVGTMENNKLNIIEGVVIAIMMGLLFLGAISLKRRQKGNKGYRLPVQLFFSVFLIGIIAIFVVAIFFS